jgi:hypothetical protein
MPGEGDEVRRRKHQVILGDRHPELTALLHTTILPLGPAQAGHYV